MADDCPSGEWVVERWSAPFDRLQAAGWVIVRELALNVVVMRAYE
jgi:hypothetical protein